MSRMDCQIVFRAGWRDTSKRDVARLSESVNYTTRRRVFFYDFRKSRDIPSAWITLSFTENPLLGVL